MATTPHTDRLTFADAAAAARAAGWRPEGSDIRGSCPDCGGKRRAWIRPGDRGAAVVGGCHHCGLNGLQIARRLLGLPDEDGRPRPARLGRHIDPMMGGADPAPDGDRLEPAAGPLPAAVWLTSVDAGGSPGAVYLAAVRGVWPVGAPLPPFVRWLPVGADIGRPWAPGAAGALVYAFMAPTDAVVAACQIEPITAGGDRAAFVLADGDDPPKRPSVYGSRFAGGARVFVARRCSGPPAAHLTEGPLDALALLSLERLGLVDLAGGAVVAAAGTGGFRPAAVRAATAGVTIWRDSDAPGKGAAVRLAKELSKAGRPVRIMRPGYSAADVAEWAEWAETEAAEREAIRHE